MPCARMPFAGGAGNEPPAGTNIVVRALPGAAKCDHDALVAELSGGLAAALKKASA